MDTAPIPIANPDSIPIALPVGNSHNCTQQQDTSHHSCNQGNQSRRVTQHAYVFIAGDRRGGGWGRGGRGYARWVEDHHRGHEVERLGGHKVECLGGGFCLDLR